MISLQARIQDVTQQILQEAPRRDIISREELPSSPSVRREGNLGGEPCGRCFVERGVEKIAYVDI